MEHVIDLAQTQQDMNEIHETLQQRFIEYMRRYEMGAMKSAVCESSDAVKSQRQ